MKPGVASFLVIWLSCTAAAAAETEESPVKVPEEVVVPSGGTGYLTVKIDRKLLPGKINVALEGLPAELRIVDTPSVKTLEKESEASAMFTLQNSSPALAGPTQINVVVTGTNARISRTVAVKIVEFGMRPLSWLVMSVSVAAVLALTGYCVWRVLTLPPVEEETLKGPLEIDTRDTVDAD